MKNGKKRTGEKILIKSLKHLQKLSNKDFQDLLRLAIINSASTFKINEQVVKKGKRKVTKRTPSFIINDFLRVATSLKSLKRSVVKSRGSNFFYDELSKELISSSQMKGKSIDTKNDLQQQILLNKRYLSKFRW